MRFYAGVWAHDYQDGSYPVNWELGTLFMESVDVSTSLTFTTQLHGGYGDASFVVYGSRQKTAERMRKYLNAHVVIYDQYGNRVFEGFVIDTGTAGDAMTVNLLGYYAKGRDILFEDIYPAASALVVKDVAQDCIDLVPTWRHVYSYVLAADYAFNKDDVQLSQRKITDVLEQIVAYGYSNADPSPAYFALWGDRTPYIMNSKLSSAMDISWFIQTQNFGRASSARITDLKYSMAEVANKVYAVYNDEGQGSSLTVPGEDVISQRRFGTIEAIVQNGGSPEGIAIAEDIRDAALAKYKYPTQIASFELTGLVRDSVGSYFPPYKIRAGQHILVTDLDSLNAHAYHVKGVAGHSFLGYVMGTSYDAASNTTTFDIGTTDTSFDVLMGRLGMSGGFS